MASSVDKNRKKRNSYAEIGEYKQRKRIAERIAKRSEQRNTESNVAIEKEEIRMKKVIALGVVCACLLSIAGCGNRQNNTLPDNAPSENQQAKGKVYYLNFKPENDRQWKELAEIYTQQTGVPVTVMTAASGTYEEKLKSEISKTEAPTLFQVNGPVGLANWVDYCYDLKDTALYEHVTGGFYLENEDGSIPAVGYALESYGIIYNKKILGDYFTMDGAKAGSIEEIDNFATLKAVADDIQKRKEEINEAFGYELKGAFSSSGLEESSYWRFTTHLANLPIYYEFRDKNITQTDAIEGTYLENYKNLWDLYITDSTVAPGLLSNSTGDESEAEFGMEEAVFFQNGDWEYANLTNPDNGYLVSADDLGMLPMYVGVEGEESIGLCTGCENYWCINKNAAPEDIEATIEFAEWCITSDEGRNAIAKEMGIGTPFDTFTEEYEVENVFKAQAKEYIEAGKTPVTWSFSTIPSEQWKLNVKSALVEYSQGTADWSAVEKAFVEGWAKEAAAAAR